MIDLCFHIYKFQKRFRWVLSSINQQIYTTPLRINVAAHTSDPFLSDLQNMQKTFKNLDIHLNVYNDDRFNARGQTRTDNIKNCKAEWLLFLDGDNVFHPQFFSNLKMLLNETDKETKRKVISVPRLTMDAKDGYRLVDNEPADEIEHAYQRTATIKTRPSFGGRVTAAGYFQLVHTPTMRLMGIDRYVNGNYDSPILQSNRKFITKSDVVFRKKFDGVYAIRSLDPIIHINHHRRILDSEYNFNKCN